MATNHNKTDCRLFMIHAHMYSSICSCKTVLDYQEYLADSEVPDDKHSPTGAGLSKLHIKSI